MGRNNVSSGAKLAPFCRRVGSFFVKLPPKEVLKKQAIERLVT
jgi:hypothetical protein